MTTLFKVQNGILVKAAPRPLSKESLIEDWVANDPGLLGLDAIVIGRQVVTDQGKYIDLLALDRSGGLIIIELKKDKTPRDIVAQVLDYASWVRTLTTPQIYQLAEKYREERLSTLYQDHFYDRIPERLNGSHSMLIVASELDPASKRIVEYLSDEHGIAINTAFFNVFESDGQEWMTTNFLLDQADVEERSERKVQPPWSGYYFVNVGPKEHRSWADMVRYGFISAGGGSVYSKPLDKLKPGDKIFAYLKSAGYVGYGVVMATKVSAAEFQTPSGLLFEQVLDQPGISDKADNLELAEYTVAVNWKKTFDIDDAKTFRGVFANQNIVCKLRDQATVDFLLQKFSVED